MLQSGTLGEFVTHMNYQCWGIRVPVNTNLNNVYKSTYSLSPYGEFVTYSSIKKNILK